MDREFPISNGFKIFYSSISLIIVGLGIFFFSEIPVNAGFLYVFALGFILSGFALAAAKFKNNIIISYDSLTYTGLFKTKSILLNNIKGFRVESSKVLYIESFSSGKLTLRSYTEHADYKELLQWLRENYQDLDSVDYQAELQRVLTDTSLGYTERDREVALKKAKVTANSFNIIGFLLFGLTFLIKNNRVFDMVLLVYPILGIFVLLTGKGLIRFYLNKKSPLYGVFLGVLFVLIALVIRSVTDYYILQFDHFWLPFWIVGLVFFAALKLTEREKTVTTMGKASIVLFLITGLVYGLCSVRVVNCSFDNSAAKVFSATVLNHDITHNKGTHYHLTISAWGPQTSPENIDVSEDEYFQDTIGSAVNVQLKKGVLNIPWYTVNK